MKFDIALIKKCVFFKYIFFFFLILGNVEAKNDVDSKNHCNQVKFNSTFDDVEFLDIKFDKYRKWTSNGLKILSQKNNNNFIPKKYKKRFQANLIVYHKDGTQCFLKAEIRQSGDHFDHIVFNNGNIVQSLDVHLKKNNIFGVTKFKLFIPITRRDENEIIITSLLSELGFIAPKTSFIKVKINGKIDKFIFQEKASKELIERSFFKDAPIYEANENLVVGTSKDKNNIFNKSMTFTRQVNPNWIQSELTKKISIEGLTRLNSVYFKNISTMQNEKKKYDQLTLNYKILSNNNYSHLIKLSIYDAIINALESGHALVPHNRKFYFDPYKKQFHPIFYDGSAGSYKRYLLGGWKSKIVKLDKNQISIKWGVSQNSIIGASFAIKKINEMDIKKLSKDLESKGLKINEKEVQNLLETINHNLLVLSRFDKNLNEANFFISINDYLDVVGEKSESFDISYSNKNNFSICEKKLNYCSSYFPEEKKFKKLIKGELKREKRKILYLGNILENKKHEFKFDINPEDKNFINKTFKFDDNDIKIKASKSVIFNYDKPKKLISISANDKDSIIIYDSIIKDIKILVNYVDTKWAETNYNKDRFNEYFLTGCLNIFNSEFHNSKIEVKNARCEDALNIVKSKGLILDINIADSSYDGLDIDFSQIDIKNLSVKNSGNDCSDFSYGKHEITFITSENCGDKAISIGEKSFIKIKKLKILNSNIGVASKDGSEVFIEDSDISETQLCVSAYKKKKEFDGGLIDLFDFKCSNSVEKFHKDDNSLIKIQNTL